MCSGHAPVTSSLPRRSDSSGKANMWIESPISRICMVLCVELLLCVAGQFCAGQTTIASKRSHDFYISLMNKSGKLTQQGEYCVLFSRRRGGEPIQLQGVFIEIAQQVGKITGRPKKYSLSPDNLGRYCGAINLGKQYYRPAFYYVAVYYTDRSGKRKKCRFFSTLK